jgi:hypothetical protein
MEEVLWNDKGSHRKRAGDHSGCRTGTSQGVAGRFCRFCSRSGRHVLAGCAAMLVKAFDTDEIMVLTRNENER